MKSKIESIIAWVSYLSLGWVACVFIELNTNVLEWNLITRAIYAGWFVHGLRIIISDLVNPNPFTK